MCGVEDRVLLRQPGRWGGAEGVHEGRHTALSLMEKAGVPISIVSRWAGHYDVSFTYRQYVHADHAEDLVQGTTALGKLYKIN